MKDFIDITYLSSYISLDDMIAAYEIKYSYRNPLMLIKSLAYHDDIDFTESIQMMSNEYSWEVIKKRLKDMEANPEMVFEKVPLN